MIDALKCSELVQDYSEDQIRARIGSSLRTMASRRGLELAGAIAFEKHGTSRGPALEGTVAVRARPS